MCATIKLYLLGKRLRSLIDQNDITFVHPYEIRDKNSSTCVIDPNVVGRRFALDVHYHQTLTVCEMATRQEIIFVSWHFLKHGVIESFARYRHGEEVQVD